MEKFTISIKKDDLKDYFDWIKSLITISSAAVAALLFKFDASATLAIKVSATAFGVALIGLSFAFAGLIEHKYSSDDNLTGTTKFVLIVGISGFLVGFGALVARLY